jgi:hypothetical protein
VTKAAQSFLNPLLAGGLEGAWDPVERVWHGNSR